MKMTKDALIKATTHNSAIPAKAGIQHNKRALRAPFKAGAGRQDLQCARTALNLHLDSRLRGNGGVCHASGWFFARLWIFGVSAQPGKPESHRECRVRKRDSGFRRNDEEGNPE